MGEITYFNGYNQVRSLIKILRKGHIMSSRGYKGKLPYPTKTGSFKELEQIYHDKLFESYGNCNFVVYCAILIFMQKMGIFCSRSMHVKK